MIEYLTPYWPYIALSLIVILVLAKYIAWVLDTAPELDEDIFIQRNDDWEELK